MVIPGEKERFIFLVKRFSLSVTLMEHNMGASCIYYMAVVENVLRTRREPEISSLKD
jgi:hypothetical protein